MCDYETRTEYFWPIINGLEWEVEYTVMLIDSEPDSYWEPGYEIWALDTGSEMINQDGIVQIWTPDHILEELCQKHFDNKY